MITSIDKYCPTAKSGRGRWIETNKFQMLPGGVGGQTYRPIGLDHPFLEC